MSYHLVNVCMYICVDTKSIKHEDNLYNAKGVVRMVYCILCIMC